MSLKHEKQLIGDQFEGEFNLVLFCIATTLLCVSQRVYNVEEASAQRNHHPIPRNHEKCNAVVMAPTRELTKHIRRIHERRARRERLVWRIFRRRVKA